MSFGYVQNNTAFKGQIISFATNKVIKCVTNYKENFQRYFARYLYDRTEAEKGVSKYRTNFKISI